MMNRCAAPPNRVLTVLHDAVLMLGAAGVWTSASRGRLVKHPDRHPEQPGDRGDAHWRHHTSEAHTSTHCDLLNARANGSIQHAGIRALRRESGLRQTRRETLARRSGAVSPADRVLRRRRVDDVTDRSSSSGKESSGDLE